MGYDVSSDITWLRSQEKKLIKKYKGKYVIIRDQDIYGAFDSKDEAVTSAQEKFGAESFLLYHMIYDPFIVSDPVERMANLLEGLDEENC